MAAATWSTRLLATLTFILVGRHLSPGAFGLVALANAFVLLLSILTGNGLSTYLIRVQVMSGVLFSTAVWTAAGVGLFFAALLAACSSLLSTVFHQAGLQPVLAWLSLVVLLNGMASAPQALLQRDFRFRALSLRSILASSVASTAAIVLAISGAGVWALVAQSVTTALVSVVTMWISCPLKPSRVYSSSDMRQILRFGLQVLATDLLLQVRDRGEEFTLGLVSSVSLLGQWSVASRLVKLIQDSGTQVVNQVSVPSFARLQHDRARLYRGYAISMAAVGALLFPVLGWFALMSTDLVPLVMGAQWASTAPLASVIALTACFAVFTYFDRPMFAIADRLRIEIGLVSFIVVLHLAATVIFAPLGLRALALALLGRNLVTLPIRQWAIHRWVGVPYSALFAVLRTAGSASVAVALTGIVFDLIPAAAAADPVARLVGSAVLLAVLYVAVLRLIARDVFVLIVGAGRETLERALRRF